MLPNEQTNLVSNGKQQSIFAGTFSKLFENKESNMFDRFSSLSLKEKILAVSAVGVMVGALLPFVAVALPFAATGAIVALTLFFAYKAVEYTFKGLAWSAKKTVKGAKDLYKTAKGGAVRAKDKVGEGVDSLKRGAHLVNKRAKEKASNVLTATADKLYRAAGNENYSDRIDNELVPDSPQKEKIQGIKEDFRAIFVNREDNSTLIKSILSGISSKIEEKIEEEIKAKKEVEFTCSADDFVEDLGLITRWKEQKRFVDNLDASSLRDLVTKRMLDKSKYFRDSVFSDHYDEIKEIIRECKEDHILKGSPFKSGKKSGKTSEVECQALESGTLSGKIENNPLYVAPPKLPRGNSLNSSQGNPNLLRGSSSSSSLSDDSPRLTQVDPPKVPGSPSIDSGMGSGSSTPKGQSLSGEELDRKFYEIMKEFPVSQLPSTKVDVVDQQFTQVKQPLKASV